MEQQTGPLRFSVKPSERLLKGSDLVGSLKVRYAHYSIMVIKLNRGENVYKIFINITFSLNF